MGVTSEESIGAIQIIIPELNEFIDFDAVKSRISAIPLEKDNSKPWVHIKFEAFISVQSSVEKTEAWLYPSALQAGADADLEALIYFKSQGEAFISSDEISHYWRQALCMI